MDEASLSKGKRQCGCKSYGSVKWSGEVKVSWERLGQL